MEWGVFEIHNDDGVLTEVHIAPCNSEGYSLYELSPEAPTIKEIIEPAPLHGKDFSNLIYVHVPIQ